MTSDKATTLKDSISASIEKLATMTDDTARSATFRQWVTAMGRFREYSMRNQILIAMQRPDATRVAGFNAWKKLGRFVKKGSKGIAIFAPCASRARLVKHEDDRERDTTYIEPDQTTVDQVADPALVVVPHEIHSFRVVYVFDIADTDGDALPKLGEHQAQCGGEELLPKLEAAATNLGLQLHYGELDGGVEGWSRVSEIAIDSRLTTSAKAGTLAHELAHAILHQGEHRAEALAKTREQRELEAEATSFAVLAHFGIEQRSDIYLASWSATAAALTDSLQTIRLAVQTILDAIEAVPEETAAAA